MRVVVAPDKFRGTATAQDAAAAMARGVRAAGHRVVSRPLADGGEGLLEVFGGANRVTSVSGPLGDDVDAGWFFDGRTAVIEMARASGLHLVGGAEGNDAIAASTYGTGELISTALESGARRVVVGVGGSATTDGGLGALRALVSSRLHGVELNVACDVRTLFVDAATQFAPQKGASPAQVELLRRRLDRLADVYLEEHGVDVRELVGGGAAGGLAGGLAAVGASLSSGFELVAEEVELDEALAEADLVITGEGFVDEGSFDGKVVGGVIEWAAEAGVPVLVVAGEIIEGSDFPDLGVPVDSIDLVARFGRERAMSETAAVVESAVAEWLARPTIPA
jgi:glycerate kinase